MNSITALSLLALVIAVAHGNPTTTDGPSTAGGSTQLPTTNSDVSKSPEEVKLKIKEQVHALTEGCKTQTKITAEQAKIVSTQAIPKTEAEKCFLECVYIGLHLVKDNKFSEPAARALATKRFGASPDELQKANSMITACVKEVVVKDASEKCAMGRLIRECFVKNGAKINFFPKP